MIIGYMFAAFVVGWCASRSMLFFKRLVEVST